MVKKIKFSPVIGATMLLITFITFEWFFPTDVSSWLLGDTPYGGMGDKKWIDGLIRLGQYGVTTLVIYAFLTVVPQNDFKVSVIGERTLYIYLLHGFIIKTLLLFIPDNVMNTLSGNYILLIIFSLGICFILGSYIVKKYTKPLIELKL